MGGPHDLSCFGAKMSKEDSTVYNLKVFHSLQEQARSRLLSILGLNDSSLTLIRDLVFLRLWTEHKLPLQMIGKKVFED